MIKPKFENRALRMLLLGTVFTSLVPAVAVAQSNTEPEAEARQDAVIVTATKRAASIKDIPQSVTAIDQQTLEVSGAVEFADYATSVPNLSFGFAGEGRQTSRQFQLRGISGAGTTAFYIDDIAVPVTMDPRILDVARVEVLRGPQGSLFGARSMGGLVRLVTNDPDLSGPSGKVHAGIASVNEGGTDYQIDGTFNGVLSDNVAFKVTGYHIQDAGFIDRVVDPDASAIIAGDLATGGNGDEFTVSDINEDTTFGFNASLFVQATDRLSFRPSFMYQKTESDGPAFVDDDVENLTKLRQFNVFEIGEDEWSMASLVTKFDLDNGQIVNSTAFFDRETLDVEDSTLFFQGFFGAPTTAVDDFSVTSEVSDETRFNTETRYVSDYEGPFNFIAGIFYQEIERDGGFPVSTIVPTGSPVEGFFGAGNSFFSLDSTFKQEEIGVFFEATYDLTDRLSVTGGGRWFDIETEETRADGGALFDFFLGSAPPPGSASQSESGFNPRVAIDFDLNDSITLYGNFAQGFRPGGGNDAIAACDALGVTVPESFDSDSLWNYEAGFKSSFNNGRTTLNGAVFQITWEDRQTQIENCGGLGFGATGNAGEAEATGFELEFATQINDYTSFDFGVGYVDAEITDDGGLASVTVGAPLFNVPEWNGAAAIDFNIPLNAEKDFYSRLDYRYTGESTSAQGNQRDSYSLVNGRLGVQSGDWDLSLYIQNAFDERANYADPVELSDSLNLIAINRPRTIGIDLRKEF
ncbi:MAG: TonB-dependent receptor [Henriciella sp.]